MVFVAYRRKSGELDIFVGATESAIESDPLVSENWQKSQYVEKAVLSESRVRCLGTIEPRILQIGIDVVDTLKKRDSFFVGVYSETNAAA